MTMANAEDFRDFAGGTLVEYEDRKEYMSEYGRANILEVRVPEMDSIEFITDGKAFFKTREFRQITMQEHDGVFYFKPLYMGFCYAIAPKGVVIPTPEERTFWI